MLRSYTLQKDGATLLIENRNGKHLYVRDFMRIDTYTMIPASVREVIKTMAFKIDDDLIAHLRRMMAAFPGTSVEVTNHGGYRGSFSVSSKVYNLNSLVHGADGSQHKTGRGADYRLRKLDGTIIDIPLMVVVNEWLLDVHRKAGGSGIYAQDNDYAHGDTRNGSFGDWFCSYSGGNCPGQGGRSVTFNYGDDAAGVVLLQRWLNAHGYPCGANDGKFRAKTEGALKKFQKDKGLAADGVFGKMSNKAMGNLLPLGDKNWVVPAF